MTRVSNSGQSEGLNRKLNALLMRAHKRAESERDSLLQDTFVPVYPMNVLLENAESQILYGRRGTGKTHSLKHLGSIKESAGHIAIFADLRTAGSSTDIYNDPNLSLAPRATALLFTLSKLFTTGSMNCYLPATPDCQTTQSESRPLWILCSRHQRELRLLAKWSQRQLRIQMTSIHAINKQVHPFRRAAYL